MDLGRMATTILHVAVYAVVLAVSLGLLTLGIRVSFEGHWVVGPLVAVSGLVGCRVTGGAIDRWFHGRCRIGDEPS